MPNKLPYEIVYLNSIQKGWELLTLEQDYVRASKKMYFKCPNKIHSYLKSYYEIMDGDGCVYCSGKNKKTYEEVVKSFKNIGWEVLTKKEDYINVIQNMNCICPKNHTCKKSYHQLINNNYGCIKCKYDNMKSPTTKLVDKLRSKSQKFIKYSKKIIEDKLDDYNILYKKFYWEEEKIIIWKSQYNIWKNEKYHIDHIIPLNAFIQNNYILEELDITFEKLLVINNLKNLRPLDPKLNCNKSYRFNQKDYIEYMKGIKNVSNI